MATPNELYEALDVLLDGVVDPREILEKMGPDQADVHVPGPIKTLKLKKRKKKDKIEKGINLKALIKPYVGKPTGMAGASAHKPGAPIAARLNRLKKPSSFKAPSSYKPGEALANRLNQKKSGGIQKGFSIKSTADGSKLLLNGAKKKLQGTTKAGQYKQEMDRNYANRTIASSAAKGRKNLVRLGMAGSAGAGAVGGAYGMARHKNKKFGQLIQEPIVKSVTWDAQITGIDEDKRQVFGWATVTHVNGEEVIDLQGDYIPLEEIEKAAYNYVLTSRVGGDMHARDGDAPRHTADLIESVIVTPEKATAMGLEATTHGWWLGMKINDDQQWEDVKEGKRNGFSIHGKGKRTDHS